MSWSSSYYAMVAEPGTGRSGDRLSVCVAHGGKHVYYIDQRTGDGWCQDLGRPAPRLSRRLRPAIPGPTTVIVQIDEHRLGLAVADGVVAGFRRARAEQRAVQREAWR